MELLWGLRTQTCLPRSSEDMQTPFTFLCCYQSCGYQHLAKLEMVCCFSFPSLTSIINDSADTCITLHIQVTKHRLQQSEQKCPVCSLSRCGKGVDRNKPAARAGLWICRSCNLRSMHDVPSQLLDSETKLWLVGVYQDGKWREMSAGLSRALMFKVWFYI